MPGRRIGALMVMVVSLLIVQLTTAPPAAADGDISISPRFGPAGSSVLVTGSDFDDDSTVSLCWGRGSCANLGKTSTDAEGSFALEVSVRENVRPGLYAVSACAQGGDDEDCGRTFFLVTPGSSATTTTTTLPPTTTTTLAPTTTTLAPTTSTTSAPTTTAEKTTSTVGPTPATVASEPAQPEDPDPPTPSTVVTEPTAQLEVQSAEPEPTTTTTTESVPAPTDRYVPPRSGDEVTEVLGESLVAEREIVAESGPSSDVEAVAAVPEESHHSSGPLPWVLLVAAIGVLGAAGGMVVHYVRRPL